MFAVGYFRTNTCKQQYVEDTFSSHPQFYRQLRYVCGLAEGVMFGYGYHLKDRPMARYHPFDTRENKGDCTCDSPLRP